jgi:hypothetical protein
MAAIILPNRLRVQPGPGAQVDTTHPLLNGATLVAVPTLGRSWTRTNTLNTNVFTTTGNAAIRGGRLGLAFVTTASGGAYFLAASAAAAIFPNTTEATTFILRRHTDTTLRGTTDFGYNVAVGNRILIAAPFSDGLVYYDHGSTDGTHRISASWGTKNTDPHSLVCVASATKGREIWRNGIKLAGNTSINGSFSASSTADISVGGDLQEVFLVGVVARAWSDSEIAEWSANPWGIFTSRRRLWLPGAPAPAPAARPQVFFCM